MSSSDDEYDAKRRNHKHQRNDRGSRVENYRVSRDNRELKRGNFKQDAQKDLSISDRRTRFPNRGSRGEYYRVPRGYRELKSGRFSQDAQNYLSMSDRRTRSPDRHNSPPMKRLRNFPITREDFITDNRVLSAHNEYKWQFQRILLNNFFVAHKEEEWFKNKYHPDDSEKEKEKETIMLEKRLEVFKEFLANGKIDSVSVDAENPGPLVHLLDSVIIKLEGGTDFDLTVLNPTEESKIEQKSNYEKKETDKKTNTVENSDGVLDSDTKVGEETNIKENAVNKNTETINVDVKKPEISEITNKNDQNNDVKPRALHRTASICLRNLAPTITKSELEAICKQYTGFRRLHMGDPLPDHLWHRNAWAVYDGDVRINDIFRYLKPVRLHGNKLGVNDIKKDPKARIIPVNGITNHYQVVRNDIKLCASIIHHFDNRSGLWQSVIDGEQPAMETTCGFVSRNPVIHNIIDFVIDEASAEEEELLGKSVPFEPEVNTEKHVHNMLKALDRMLLYLRIVHSVDFYNYKKFANEDTMPSRCSIMHARSAPTLFPHTKREIVDYCRYFRSKADSLIVSTNGVSENELIQLGSRDEEAEVNMFINCNTEKVSTDKWLCHLSGKKFISPEFVREHIVRRYTDQINNVKKEVKYFNNYLCDPNRPQPFSGSRPAPNM